MISQNSARDMGDAKFWGNSEGTSGVPKARGSLTPYLLTTRKAALILLSQAEDLQARREGSAGISHLLALEPSGLRRFTGRRGTRSGDPEQRAAFHI